MAKKQRSQRQHNNNKKANSSSTLPNGIVGSNNNKNDDSASLDDEYTVADSVSSFDNSFQDDSQGGGGEDGLTPSQSRHTKLVEILSLISSLPTEKRSARREQHLRLLFKALTQYSTPPSGIDTIQSSLSTIISSCLHSLRSGIEPEQYASCRCLETLSLLLGEWDEYCEEIDTPLTKWVKHETSSPQVRSAALKAMSMACFVCSTDAEYRLKLLSFCETLMSPTYKSGQSVVPTALRRSALECWTLLASTLENSELSGDEEGVCGNVLELLRDCLEKEELRESAGGCLSLIHEGRLNLGWGREGMTATERRYKQAYFLFSKKIKPHRHSPKSTRRKPRSFILLPQPRLNHHRRRNRPKGSWDDSPHEELIEELKILVSQLSHQSGHHMSKKAKKHQRSIFRDYQSTLIDDEPPDETITLRNKQSFVFKSWKEILPLNLVRQCLQSGFQLQLMWNGVLHAMFDLDVEEEEEMEGLSQVEKRLLYSKTSERVKSMDLDRNRKRRGRMNAKNYFITADGEDI